MAKSVLEIVFRTLRDGTGDRETKSALKDLESGFKNVASVAGTVVAAGMAVNKIYQQTVTVFVDYAAQVRDMTRLTGLGAAETSKLIQAADDLAISYESLNKALWAASKQGIDVSIQSLASMADEYVNLGSAADQAEFLAKKFGKSGAEMGKLMEQGGQGVIAATNAIQGNLVLTDQAVKQAREYEIQLDNLNDAWEAFKVGAGAEFIQPLVTGMKVLNGYIETNATATEESQNKWTRWMPIASAMEGMIDIQRIWKDVKEEDNKVVWMQSSYAEKYVQVLKDSVPTMEEQIELQRQQAEQLQAVSQANQGLLGVMFQMQGEYETYTEKNDALKTKLQELTSEQEKVPEWSNKYKDYQTQIDETKTSIEELATEHEMASKRIVFSLLHQKFAMDGLTVAEFQSLISIGKQWGILDEKIVESALLADDMTTKMAEGYTSTANAAGDLNQRLGYLYELNGKSMTFTVYIDQVGSIPDIPTPLRTKTNGLLQPMASGGQLGSGWTMVGEEGPELITPSGYVIPNDVSRALLASGILPDRAFAMGGDLMTEGTGSIIRMTTAPILRGRSRSSPSSSSNSVSQSVMLNEMNQAAQAAAAITPMAELTAAAVQTSASVQQATAMQTQQLMTSIAISNEGMTNEQRETNRLLRDQSNRLARDLVAAMIQANP